MVNYLTYLIYVSLIFNIFNYLYSINTLNEIKRRKMNDLKDINKYLKTTFTINFTVLELKIELWHKVYIKIRHKKNE